MTIHTSRYVAATLIAIAIVAAAHASAGRTRPNEQVFVTPRAQAENVRFAQPRPGLIEVTYDLVSDDPRAVFSVTLDASDDGGQTWNVKPKNMTGDVGANVTPGTGKRIVWEAGKDVEVLKFDQFRFRLNPVAARLPPLRTATGGLSVQTTPAGATVLVDGQSRGSTPTVIGDLSPGAHQLTLRRDGYLENQSTVQVRPNAVDPVSVVLTAATPNTIPIVQAPRGGSNLKWLLLGGAGAAVAGGVAATRGGGGAAPVATTTTTTTIPPRGALTVTSSPNPGPVPRRQRRPVQRHRGILDVWGNSDRNRRRGANHYADPPAFPRARPVSDVTGRRERFHRRQQFCELHLGLVFHAADHANGEEYLLGPGCERQCILVRRPDRRPLAGARFSIACLTAA